MLLIKIEIRKTVVMETKQVVFECPRCVIKPKCDESRNWGICNQGRVYDDAERIKDKTNNLSEVISGKQCSIKVLCEV